MDKLNSAVSFYKKLIKDNKTNKEALKIACSYYKVSKNSILDKITNREKEQLECPYCGCLYFKIEERKKNFTAVICKACEKWVMWIGKLQLKEVSNKNNTPIYK